MKNQIKTIDKIDTMLQQAQAALDKPDFKSALKLSEDALHLAMERGNRNGIIESWLTGGIAHLLQGKNRKAEQFLHHALKFIKESDDKRFKNKLYSLLGKVYCDLGDSEEALRYLSMSLKIARGLADESILANNYLNMASALTMSNNFSRASENFEKAKSIAEKVDDESLLGSIYTNMSFFYDKQGKAEEALNTALKALPLCEKHNQWRFVVILHNTIATCYYNLERLDDALTHYEKCLELARKYDFGYHILSTLIHIGNAYRLKAMYEKADEYLTEAENSGLFHDNTELWRMYFDACLNLYEDMGDYKQAYEKHKQLLKYEINEREKSYASKKK